MDEFLCLLKEMDNDKTSNSIFEPAFTQIEHFCDYVFCIDITAGMAPLINNIKEIITNLYNRQKHIILSMITENLFHLELE